MKGFIESQLVVDPEERWQAGMVSGVLWTLGTLIVLCMPVLPGGNSQHLLVRDVVSGCGFLWGLASLFLIDWRALAPVLINVTYLVGTAAIGFLVWATNVGTTAGPLFLCWMALFACYFYRPGAALFWVVLLLFVQALPLVYEPHAATRGAALITLLVAVVGDASIGVAVLTAKRRLVSLRARAEQEALTDPLTGAANHRVLDTQLRADLDRATGSGELLAAAVIDVDHLKQINDIGGHDRGDAALILVATSLRTLSRAGDTVARSGGDEFTWLLPGANASEARRRTEEARELIERSSGGNVTLSIGLADSSRTTEPAELMRLADGALYWSKAHGRNRTQVYDPDVVDALSAEERADRLARSQALVGLRALARAIDAKDPVTHAHSERVAALAGQLALAAGWDHQRADLLSEAALVHDVGKIGIDDRILHKRGPLSLAEREHVQTHAELSARIVEGVLSTEQVDWIRTHHERADGTGYPQGLEARDIPPGGALLAVADAFDVMTVGRAYNRRRMYDEALQECLDLTGAQFCPAAVAALERLLEPDLAAPMDRTTAG